MPSNTAIRRHPCKARLNLLMFDSLPRAHVRLRQDNCLHHTAATRRRLAVLRQDFYKPGVPAPRQSRLTGGSTDGPLCRNFVITPRVGSQDREQARGRREFGRPAAATAAALTPASAPRLSS